VLQPDWKVRTDSGTHGRIIATAARTLNWLVVRDGVGGSGQVPSEARLQRFLAVTTPSSVNLHTTYKLTVVWIKIHGPSRRIC